MLLRVVLYAGLPALILGVISRVELQPALALLPVSAGLTILVTGLIAWRIGRLLALPRAALGVFVTGPMIMNMALEYPFVLATWGEAGVARLAMFDFGNGLLTLTLTYVVAGLYGDRAGNWRKVMTGVASFPPFLALMLALVVNLSGLVLPVALTDTLRWIGETLILLVMVALGIHLDVGMLHAPPVLAAIGLRLGLGLSLGWLWTEAFDLHGLERTVLLFGAVAPVGFNTLVYASLHNLDREFAASIVSLSLLLALLYLPVLLFLL